MKKITLSRETLRALDEDVLSGVLGGDLTKTKHNTKLTYYTKFDTCDPRKCRG